MNTFLWGIVIVVMWIGFLAIIGFKRYWHCPKSTKCPHCGREE